MRTLAATARRSLLGPALLGLAAIPAAAQLHPFHAATYTEGNLFGFGPAESDNFGHAVASGDFNGDGIADLATGVPHDDNLGALTTDSGIVIVRYGVRGAGLKGGIANTVLSQMLGGSPDDAEHGDDFGWSLAVGDFDGDRYDDLAVGIRYDKDSEAYWVGGVQVYYGSATGIQLSGAHFFNQWSAGLPGGSEWDWEFGAAVAAGDFDGDGFADLAIGQPSYTSDFDFDCGRVVVLYGAAAGLTAESTQVFTQDHPGMDGSDESDDELGAALAAGDFNGDGRDDLAVGVPGENDGGGVQFILGSAAGLTAAGNNLWTQDDTGVQDTDDDGDELGAALAVGDFDRDGYDDVAVGVPGEGVSLAGGGTAAQAGAVHVFFGSPSGPSGPSSWMWTSSSTGLGTSESADRWGAAVAAGDFDHDGFDDLAIGAPGEAIGSLAGGGEVTILRGYPDGVAPWGGQVINQGSLGVPDVVEAQDSFGFALATGDFDGNGHADLVTGAPSESTVQPADGAETVLYGFVFADDFETAGTAHWQLTQSGNLRGQNTVGATTAAKLGTPASQYGLRVNLLDQATNAVYVMAGPNQGFANNKTLKGTFFIDPRNLTMSPNPGVNVFQLMRFAEGTAAGSKTRLTFELNRNDSVGGWALLASSWNDSAGGGGSLQFAGGAGFALTGDPNAHTRIDFEWTAGNPGNLTMWKTRYVGGAPDAAGKQLMFSVGLPGTQSAAINALYAGMVSGKDVGTSGALNLDEISLSR